MTFPTFASLAEMTPADWVSVRQHGPPPVDGKSVTDWKNQRGRPILNRGGEECIWDGYQNMIVSHATFYNDYMQPIDSEGGSSSSSQLHVCILYCLLFICLCLTRRLSIPQFVPLGKSEYSAAIGADSVRDPVIDQHMAIGLGEHLQQLPHEFNETVVQYVRANGNGMDGNMFVLVGNKYRLQYRSSSPRMSDMFERQFHWWDFVHASDKPYILNTFKLIQQFASELKSKQKEMQDQRLEEAAIFARKLHEANEEAKKQREFENQARRCQIEAGRGKRTYERMNSFGLPPSYEIPPLQRMRSAQKIEDEKIEDERANAVPPPPPATVGFGDALNAIASTAAVGTVSCLKNGGAAVIGTAVTGANAAMHTVHDGCKIRLTRKVTGRRTGD
jgi:hypothetical protein